MKEEHQTKSEERTPPPGESEPLAEEDISSPEEVVAPALQTMENAQLVPVDYFEPNPYQPRTSPGDGEIEELAVSIRDVGLLEPLVVARRGRRRFIVIAGHRRLAAAKKAGLQAVPCIVRELRKSEFLMLSLIENLQRTDLTPLEEAQALRQLIKEFGWTYRETAAKIGKSAAFVNDRLLLLDLPEDVKKAMNEGRLSLKKAIEAGKIPNEIIRARLLRKGNEGTLDEFKQMIEEELSRVKTGRKQYQKSDILPALREFSSQIEGVRVTKDRLTIKFESTQDLLAAITLLTELLRESEEFECENNL